MMEAPSITGQDGVERRQHLTTTDITNKKWDPSLRAIV